jgi:hypothetical protein
MRAAGAMESDSSRSQPIVAAGFPISQTESPLTKPFLLGSVFKLTHCHFLTPEQIRNIVLVMFKRSGEAHMLRIFVEEAAALASLTLFVGMIAVWAQLFSQF